MMSAYTHMYKHLHSFTPLPLIISNRRTYSCAQTVKITTKPSRHDIVLRYSVRCHDCKDEHWKQNFALRCSLYVSDGSIQGHTSAGRGYRCSRIFTNSHDYSAIICQAPFVNHWKLIQHKGRKTFGDLTRLRSLHSSVSHFQNSPFQHWETVLNLTRLTISSVNIWMRS